MREIEGCWDEEQGLNIIDKNTGEIYAQDEVSDFVEEMLTEEFGHELEIPEENKPLYELLKSALKQKDFHKSSFGQLFGMSELETRTLAYRIKNQRSQKKLEIAQISARVGVLEEEFLNWEMGESEPIDAQLKKVAWELGTSLEYLLGKTDDSPVFEKFDKEGKEKFYQIFQRSLDKLSKQLSNRAITKEEFEKQEKIILKVLEEAPNVEVRRARIGSCGIAETSSGRSFAFDLEDMEQKETDEL